MVGFINRTHTSFTHTHRCSLGLVVTRGRLNVFGPWSPSFGSLFGARTPQTLIHLAHALHTHIAYVCTPHTRTCHTHTSQTPHTCAHLTHTHISDTHIPHTRTPHARTPHTHAHSNSSRTPTKHRQLRSVFSCETCLSQTQLAAGEIPQNICRWGRTHECT